MTYVWIITMGIGLEMATYKPIGLSKQQTAVYKSRHRPYPIIARPGATSKHAPSTCGLNSVPTKPRQGATGTHPRSRGGFKLRTDQARDRAPRGHMHCTHRASGFMFDLPTYKVNRRP